MANLQLSMIEIFKQEFGNKPELFVHRNSGENGFTVGGIYQKANPHDIDYDFIKDIIYNCKNDIKRASNMLFYDKDVMGNVINTYEKNYWNALKLYEVDNQFIANKIFSFGIVSGVKTSAKLAQKVVGTFEDGIIGRRTINAINSFNDVIFNDMFTKLQIEHFELIVANNPSKSIYLDGWKNRARLS